jgi:dephospho-CoA kinase
MIVIGITGTLGAGKGTIVDYLVNKKHFAHFSVRGFLCDRLRDLGEQINRDTMTLLANRLRKENSPSYITDELFRLAAQSNQNCIIESIRTPGEIDSLRNLGKFILFAVDADPLLRYERIVVRGSETDKVSYETFIANEQREMSSSDPNHQNLAACIARADYRFNNNGSVEQLISQVDAILLDLNL